MRGVDWVFGMLLIVLVLLQTFNAFQGSLRDDSIRELVKLEVSQQIGVQKTVTTINTKYATIVVADEKVLIDGSIDAP